MLNITKTMENGGLTITLEGELNTVTAPMLDKAVNEVINSASTVTFDLKALEYISSAGLRVLLTTQQAMDARGLPTVMIKNASTLILDTFELTGFDTILNLL